MDILSLNGNEVAGTSEADQRNVINNKIAALKVLASTIISELTELEQNGATAVDVKLDLANEVQRFETDIIKCALVRTGGRQRQAARLLHVKPTTLNSKIKRYGIMAYEVNM
jgi:DNA-binding NtrC family response regulator